MSLVMRTKATTDLIDKVEKEARAGTEGLRVIALAVCAHASAMLAVAEAINSHSGRCGRGRESV